MSSLTTAATEPLWAIEEELEMLLDSVDTCPDELRRELESRLAEYIAKEIEKVDRIAGVLSSLEQVQANAKFEIDRLRARSQSAERASKRLEGYVLEVIRKREGKPLKGRNVTLSVRHSESVVIVDSNLVPPEFKRTSIVVDVPKDPLRRAIKSGTSIPGVVLQPGEHLVRK